MRRTFIAARVSDPFPVPAKALPFPDASLSTRPVCGRNSPVQTGRFPSSVETAKERDRRSVSAVSVYATYATLSPPHCLSIMLQWLYGLYIAFNHF